MGVTDAELLQQATTAAAAAKIEIMNWILSGIVAILLAVVIYFIQSLLKRINVIIDQQEKNNVLFAQFGEQIKTLFTNKVEMDKDMKDLGARVREIELNCSSRNHRFKGD